MSRRVVPQRPKRGARNLLLGSNIWRTEQLGMKPAARWLSTTCVGCGMSLAWQICDANAETCSRIHAYAFVGWSTRNRALLPRPINDTPDVRSLPHGLTHWVA